MEAITIWVFEKSVGEDATGEILVPRIPVIGDQAVSGRLVRPRGPTPRRAIQIEQPLGDIVQQGRESETSGESEDQKVSNTQVQKGEKILTFAL